ncbi:hypothetical protein BUE76_16165 [Cnuella takakiae]|nr:hypothetical protein BUE76_16165 [Cnuella takakiae]
MISIVVVGIVLASIVFIGMGLYIMFHSFLLLFNPAHRQEAMLALLESVDVFLIALVFLVLAIGLVQLFLGKSIAGMQEHTAWLRFDDFTELKLVLWKTILTTMLIAFFVELYKNRQHPGPELLLFPGSILLISLSLFLLKQKHHHSSRKEMG